ncbi:hypothetical protein F9K75_20830 [Brucella intermedia]|nr:hypothetical protein F9K75_20830 [Brucella intermedia]
MFCDQIMQEATPTTSSAPTAAVFRFICSSMVSVCCYGSFLNHRVWYGFGLCFIFYFVSHDEYAYSDT